MVLAVEEQAVTSWEGVALVQVAQAAMEVKAAEGVALPQSLDLQKLLGCAGVPQLAEAESKTSAGFSQAYRAIDQKKKYYGEVLAECSGLYGLKIKAPRFPGVLSSQSRSGIVLAPFALRSDLDIPVAVWRAVVKHLRSYGEPVYLLGENPQQRMDAAAFAEADMWLDCSIQRKLELLCNAKLVVGPPNGWLWAASAWEEVKLLVLYPDNIPPARWFLWDGDKYGRLAYPAHMLQIPVLLAGLRKLIEAL